MPRKRRILHHLVEDPAWDCIAEGDAPPSPLDASLVADAIVRVRSKERRKESWGGG